MIEEAEAWKDEGLQMLEWDPTSFERGIEVSMSIIDLPSEFQNRDSGKLLWMTAERVSIEGIKKHTVIVRIHYPRSIFKIAKVKGTL